MVTSSSGWTRPNKAIDRIPFERHDLSKRAKDFGSAAVMLALLIAFVIWAAVLYQEFIQ